MLVNKHLLVKSFQFGLYIDIFNVHYGIVVCGETNAVQPLTWNVNASVEL